MADDEALTSCVKLRLLYQHNGENHLARPPNSYDVQTAPIDDVTTIGVIDLRTCLDAVLASSPELLPTLDNDFSVYTYDYSEPEAPLVGHGMLSRVLHLDQSNEAMITGKIVQNMMAKFNKQAQPFLEVKFRFTPIASGFQRGRSGSVSSQDGMQPQSSAFSHSGPQRPQSPADLSRLESVQRMMHEGGPPRENSFNNSFSWCPPSRPTSRPGTPNHMAQYQLPPQPVSTHSRSGSDFQYYHQDSNDRRSSFSGYYSGDENVEEGPPKKRARTMPVKRASKASFNIEQQPSTLRAVATAASSLRVHQPVPFNPATALQRGFSTEEPVRPPTPVAARARQPAAKPRKSRKTPESEQARLIVEPSSPNIHPLPQPPVPSSNVSSPEEIRHPLQNASTMSTPADIPSSPPVMLNDETSPEAQRVPQQTSPQLPPQPQQRPQLEDQDSGFMSAQLGDKLLHPAKTEEDDLFENFDMAIDNYEMSKWFNDINPLTAEESHNPVGAEIAYTPVFDDESTFEGPTPQPESQGTAKTPQPEPQQRIPVPTLQQSTQSVPPENNPPPQNNFQRPPLPPVTTDKNGRPLLAPRPGPVVAPPMQRSASTLPPVPASDPGARPFQRANTWAPDLSDATMSDAPGPKDGKSKPARKRVGKEQTKARLENAIATGDMPPYCYNCGAIETPAWRRGYIKVFTCPIGDVQTSLEPGDCCFKEIIETHPDGSAKVWKGWMYQKTEGQSEDGWQQINLCNPCGLYLHKSKIPRPPDRWQKKDNGPKDKRRRKRPPKPPKSRTNPRRGAAGNLASDVQEPPSEDSSPADTSLEDGPDDNNDSLSVSGDNDDDCQELELPPIAKSASVQVTRKTVVFEDIPQNQRQVQSSPLVRGTAAEPIEVDLTPNSRPLRRVLFPSPDNKKADTQSHNPLNLRPSESLLPSFVRRSPRLNKVRDIFAEGGLAAAITVDGEEKENLTPHLHQIASFEDLFNEQGLMLPPTTPTPKRRSERILQRTPGRAVSGESHNADDHRASKTPKQDSGDLARLFLDTIARNQNPEEMTPLTRGIHRACTQTTPGSKTPKRNKFGLTPKRNGNHSITFDFPDLPSLHSSSPFKDGDNLFSELTTEKLYPEYESNLKTDATMPSSPPIGMSGSSFWNNEAFADFMDISVFDAAACWEEIESQEASKVTPKKSQRVEELLAVEQSAAKEALRRSPRRAGKS